VCVCVWDAVVRCFFFSVGSKIRGESAGPNGECVAVVMLCCGVECQSVSHKSKSKLPACFARGAAVIAVL
jgi:hypothetical protein